jgi:hypothetical protein
VKFVLKFENVAKYAFFLANLQNMYGDFRLGKTAPFAAAH